MEKRERREERQEIRVQRVMANSEKTTYAGEMKKAAQYNDYKVQDVPLPPPFWEDPIRIDAKEKRKNYRGEVKSKKQDIVEKERTRHKYEDLDNFLNNLD